MSPRDACWLLLGTSLSLSIGWGIRGNFGHEYGAMIPGALASMAGVILAGRSDWLNRAPAFGCFGALGWSFGGSISYMQVIGYTHSGHSPSVLYGFACLFFIGFVWAAMGGAGMALAACRERKDLHEFVAPLLAVFAAWVLQDVLMARVEPADAQFRHASWWYWYDTDWLAVLTASGAVICLALVRRRLDSASCLILHMAIGWFAAFLTLVVGLGWRMTPPRGDNWAGCAGMVAGMWVYFHRQGWRPVLGASLVTGIVGGVGFATATMLKLVEVRSGMQTNWHSVLEQTYGLINGIGVGLAFRFLAGRVPVLSDAGLSRATRVFCIIFVALVIPYLNLAKNPAAWVRAKSVPVMLYGLTAQSWFNLAFAIVALVAALLLYRHQHRRLAVIPESALGKAQLLCLAFLWCLVIGNFERALAGFAPQRLITEGVIHVNAAVCTVLLLWRPVGENWPRTTQPILAPLGLGRVAAAGLAAMLLVVPLNWLVVRSLYGDQFAGHSNLHIRFGPGATATAVKPSPSQAHP